jgi:peptide/nickel transport system permease protein
MAAAPRGVGRLGSSRPVFFVPRGGRGTGQPASAAQRRGQSVDRGLVLGVGLLGLLVLTAVLGPLVWTENPNATDIANSLQSPSWAHPMGTDGSGRDILARFNRGSQISLAMGIAVVLTSGLVGCAAGLFAGMVGGIGDILTMRALDAVLAFPPLILAMAVAIGLGAGITSAAIGAALVCMPVYARLLRSDVIRIRELPHVEAARAVGVPSRLIVRRHILPHTVPTMLVQSAAVFGSAIITLAALGFVGLGAQIPTAEWGAMITDGLQYALTGGWWISVFPGVGLLIALLGANLLADGIRDRLDPRGSPDGGARR